MTTSHTENRYTTSFKEYVCEGDTINTEINGVEYTARIVRDDCTDAPDERQDGFWPSLNPSEVGWIGSNDKEEFERQQKEARAVFAAWKNDEWFYCGVVISAAQIVTVKGHVAQEVILCKHAASLWGIECNYPKQGANDHLTEVANDLLNEAIDYVTEAKKQIA